MGVLLGLVVIVVMASIGDPEAQSATQALSTLALAAAVVIGVLWAVASGLGGWSLRSCLLPLSSSGPACCLHALT
ncbi:hypothetical protein GCM10027282_07310 [Frigoribacterium salinisoli]